jgi:CRP-like cAMP-binding protein
VTIAAKKYAEQLKNSKFSPKLESIIRKQSPVLYETHRLFESLDHNDHKKIFYQLYKTIKARKFVPLNTRDEQVENAKWNRLTYSRREQKIKQPTANQNHSDHDVFFNTVPDMTTDGIIHRIITSLSSSHPSDIKKVIQEIDKNSRMNRPKPIVSEIINICSQSQRSKHNLQYVEDFLKMQVAFQDTPDYVVSELANYMRTEIYQDNGHAIFRQGDLGNRFYFIIRGSVRLTINKPGTSVLDQNPPQNFLAIMKTGEKFGEFALLNDLPRNSSAFAAEKNTAVLTLEKDQFIRLLAVTYQVTLRNNIKLLSNFPLFKKLDNQGLRIIAEKLFTRTVPPNTIILEEGSLVESVFFIRSGKCAVFKKIFMNEYVLKIM